MKRGVLIFVFSFFVYTAFGTHIRGGRIEVSHISGTTYNIHVIIYMKTSGVPPGPINLDSIRFGDNNLVYSASIDSMFDLPGDIRICHFNIQHTYSGNGNYLIHCTIPNRVANIKNVPNSVATSLYLETYININPFFICGDYSVHLYDNPLILHSYKKDLNLSRAGFDPNWDSLSYSLLTSLNVGYSLPSGVSIDPISGVFKWNGDSMYSPGLYSFGIRIDQWRFGILISYVNEEFQVLLDSSVDTTSFFNMSFYPPDLTTHLSPGDTFHLHVEYTDTANSAGFVYYSDLTNYNWNYYGSGNVYYGDLSFIASQNEVRSDPFRILFSGRTDLTYLVYVDGSSNQTCKSVGVDELEDASVINIFPNPTNGIIHFDLKNPNAELSVFNQIGEIVFQKNSIYSESIDLGFLVGGIYILRLKDSASTYYTKLVKLK